MGSGRHGQRQRQRHHAGGSRLLAQHRDQLFRGLRLVFWSGHSHGRYSGSTWYADNHWEELHDRCVAHVNIDSTGARGATFYGSFPANLELGPFGEAVVRAHTRTKAQARRMSRAGDMSFNGIGIPALFMSLSQVPFSDDDTDYVSLAFGKLIGGKMPWWWHTSEDTIDKVDPDVLRLDTQIYVSTLWRLCHDPLLPMDFRPVAADIVRMLEELEQKSGAHLNLSYLQETSRTAPRGRKGQACRTACRTMAEMDAAGSDAAAIEQINRQLVGLSRALIPVTYAAAGEFDHDPAWGLPHLPGLQGRNKKAD